jgi:hypothetical protein
LYRADWKTLNIFSGLTLRLNKYIKINNGNSLENVSLLKNVKIIRVAKHLSCGSFKKLSYLFILK